MKIEDISPENEITATKISTIKPIDFFDWLVDKMRKGASIAVFGKGLYVNMRYISDDGEFVRKEYIVEKEEEEQ